jgi:hypothetical protein
MGLIPRRTFLRVKAFADLRVGREAGLAQGVLNEGGAALCGGKRTTGLLTDVCAVPRTCFVFSVSYVLKNHTHERIESPPEGLALFGAVKCRLEAVGAV